MSVLCVCVSACTLSLLLIINVIMFFIETLENKEKDKEAATHNPFTQR